MTIFGKSLSEYVAFTKLFIGLILVVGIIRLALSLAGVPNATAKWFSITGVLLIGLVYYSIRVYTTGFGSYKHLLPVIFLQCATSQAVVAASIILAIITNHDNIYSAPEYSPTADGKTWLHVGAHLVFGLIIGPLIWWLVGCLIMFITKKVAPRR